jgi:hypothetical protein
MKRKHNPNLLRKYFLMVAILILLFAGGYRAFTLYKTYRNYEQEIASIELGTHTNIHNVLKVVITEAYDSITYKTKMDSITLHRMMIESMSINKIYDNIVNMNLDNDFIKILDEVFDLSKTEEKTIVTIGTKDFVFYCKSNIESDIYDHLDCNSKYITWEEYFTNMKNPEITKIAYEDLVMHRADYVILRIDGYYPDGRYYTINDVIEDYHENGLKNMDKYYILTLGVITDTGDIFGESDDNFMQHNPNVNKIYIFKAVSLENYINNYKPLLDSFDESMSTKIIQVRNTTEFSNALINIFLITTSIIIVMIVIKSLDVETINTENNNKSDQDDR